MRHLPQLAAIAALIALPAHAAPDTAINVELNAAETAQGRCRVAFVVDNKGEAMESLKLDLAVFNREGVLQRRLVTEMGPLRKAKTIVRSFDLEVECGGIGSILVNDVTACAPGEPGACLDHLALSSKAKDIRFYK